jgi:diguanylate cyclase (GGDEF)-like protein
MKGMTGEGVPQPELPSAARQLRQFLAWLTPLAFGFAAFAAIGGALWGDRPSLAVAGLTAGFGALSLAALVLASRGRQRAAGLIVGFGILVTALVIVAIQPRLYPTLAMIPLLAVALALPYADDRTFRGLLLGCWLASVAIGALGELVPRESRLPEWFATAFSVASLGATVAMVLLLLWQSRARLQAQVSGVEAAKADLEQAVAALRGKEEQVRNLAYYDALTGLPNRRLFSERLELAVAQARNEGQRLAVLFVDLDHFKDVNDRHGHAVGDQLLHEVGIRLRHCVRAGDTVARFAGDEFTVLLPGIDSADAAGRVAEKVLACLRPPARFGPLELRVTASAGIGLYPAHADSATGLLKRADAAMYRAKQAGRDAYRAWSPAAS